MDADLNYYKSSVVSLVFTLVITLTAATATTGDPQNSDKVLLSDVKALTLYQGRMTTYRRTSPVPQLKCVGGTAQCKVTPQTVQCINSGSDGSSIQWECKAVMDKAYRFGQIHVSCEGFEYPKDPYVLRGSCGLEYTVELTGGGGGHHHKYQSEDEKKFIVGGVIVLIGLGLIVCVIIAVCQNKHSQSYAPNYMPNQGPPPPYGGYGAPAYGAPAYGPPAYGYSGPAYGSSGGIGGGGFLTGAATGGVLGYMAGRSNTFGNYGNRCDSGGWGGGGGGGFDSSGQGGGFDDSGSRMTSGFGETSGR